MSVKAELTERDRRYLERSLNGPVWKVVLSVGTPLALYQELAMIFTVMDTMMAAHISKESVSAVAYLAQVNLILTAVGGGLAVGAGIQISRAYGEGDLELVRKRVSSLYALSLSVGLAMLALILPFTVQFLRLAGTPDFPTVWAMIAERFAAIAPVATASALAPTARAQEISFGVSPMTRQRSGATGWPRNSD